MSPSARAALASALAPLAVLAVVVSGVSAVVVASGEEGTAETEEEVVSPAPGGADVLLPPGFQAYDGDEAGATLLLPASGRWTVRDAGDTIGFAVDGSAELAAPASYDENFCRRLPGVPRAFLGFADPLRGEEDADGAVVEERAREVLETWVEAARTQEDGDVSEVTDVTGGPVRLDDGTEAWTASAISQVDPEDPDKGRCGVNPLQVRTLSAPSSTGIVTVVLVRGVTAEGGDRPEDLDAESVDEILRSLDPR